MLPGAVSRQHESCLSALHSCQADDAWRLAGQAGRNERHMSVSAGGWYAKRVAQPAHHSGLPAQSQAALAPPRAICMCQQPKQPCCEVPDTAWQSRAPCLDSSPAPAAHCAQERAPAPSTLDAACVVVGVPQRSEHRRDRLQSAAQPLCGWSREKQAHRAPALAQAAMLKTIARSLNPPWPHFRRATCSTSPQPHQQSTQNQQVTDLRK